MAASNLEQFKAQAQVLLPLIKELKEELGDERAYKIARKAMKNLYCGIGQDINKSFPGSPTEKIAATTSFLAADNALDFEVFKQTPETYEYKVTGCRYADFYKELGETELGFLFVCDCDFHIAEGISPDLELKRTQTIMQGAGYCDFCYEIKK